VYESDHTKFMRDLMQQKPQIADEQRKGRALWWDRSIDPREQRAYAESRVRQQAYVYQNKS
jgi:hypothetical protein